MVTYIRISLRQHMFTRYHSIRGSQSNRRPNHIIQTSATFDCQEIRTKVSPKIPCILSQISSKPRRYTFSRWQAIYSNLSNHYDIKGTVKASSSCRAREGYKVSNLSSCENRCFVPSSIKTCAEDFGQSSSAESYGRCTSDQCSSCLELGLFEGCCYDESLATIYIWISPYQQECGAGVSS